MSYYWKSLGCYSVLAPRLNGLELVSVNTIFFSKKYTAQDFQKNCASVQTSAPSDTFAWLQDQLASAQEAKRPVWLIMHIPPGIDGYASTHPSDGPYTPASCANDVVPLWH